jgi:hypothetical protein
MCVSSRPGVATVTSRLTTKTNTLFRIAHTSTNSPAPKTTVAAIFFMSFRRDFQSIGMGIKMM